MNKLEHQMKVTPKIWIGLLIVIGYLCIVVPMQKLSGVSYVDMGTSADNLFRTAVLSMTVGAVALIIVTSILGWWRPALFDNAQKRWTFKWPLIAPLIMLLGVIGNFAITNYSYFDSKFIFTMISFTLLVGFCEELTVRGLLLTSLRSRLSEVWVCILTSLIFGLMHGSNFFLGQDMGTTVLQIIDSALTGFTLYLVRRSTGNLIWAMLLHGLYDASVFMSTYNNGEVSALGGLSALFANPLSLLFLIIIFFKTRKSAK